MRWRLLRRRPRTPSSPVNGEHAAARRALAESQRRAVETHRASERTDRLIAVVDPFTDAVRRALGGQQ